MEGSVMPTFKVPGMSSSCTKPKNLRQKVVVANEPIPRVSKKFTTTPMPRSSSLGLCNFVRSLVSDRTQKTR